jgi:hypothetical protein
MDPNPTSDMANADLANNDYLKKHQLDLKVLPNRKMIKLSDLRSLVSVTRTEPTNNDHENTSAEATCFRIVKIDQVEQPLEEENDSFQADVNAEKADENIYESDSDDEFSSMGSQNNNELSDEDVKEDDDSAQPESNTNGETKSLRTRKKREPSLKLQQKLRIDDLELIVNCVRNKQAKVYIADIKKENYVDKILRVKINGNETLCLSNGNVEALLKKSMFPKDLNTLFDTFVNALCDQALLVDASGKTKPILKCLVVDCEFSSFSEAEIMRHIKRHLAQDGYTCPHCSHQFASMTNLQRHLKIHMGTSGKEIKCSLCDYKASTLTHVKRHMAHKHLERSLPCPHCSFMGATNAELKIHMARKHLELTGKNPLFLPKYLRKDYHCSICKEQYNDFKV